MKHFSIKYLSMKATASAVLAMSVPFGVQAGLVNGSFETLLVPMPAANFIVTNKANVPGWNTSATDNNIEIWQQPGPDFDIGFAGTPADLGIRYAELNATQTSTLFQDIPVSATNPLNAGSIVGWQLSHRGRRGIDVMALTITDLGADNVFGTTDDFQLFTRQFSDSNSAWGRYSGTGIVARGNTVRFAFAAVSSTGPDTTFGNLLDSADFGIGVGTQVPEPASLLLAGTALMAAGMVRRRRKQGE